MWMNVRTNNIVKSFILTFTDNIINSISLFNFASHALYQYIESLRLLPEPLRPSLHWNIVQVFFFTDTRAKKDKYRRNIIITIKAFYFVNELVWSFIILIRDVIQWIHTGGKPWEFFFSNSSVNWKNIELKNKNKKTSKEVYGCEVIYS